MKRLVYSLLLALVLIASGARAEVVCDYSIIEDYSVIAGGEEWRHITYGWVCYDNGGGTSGGGTGTDPGGNGNTPLPPSVRIVSASDENPNQVVLRFDYSGAPTSMTLEKNGVIVSSGLPAAFGLYGSLDNMIFDSVLTVTMCNAGGCSEDFANVQRSTQRLRVEGAISAQWQDYIFTDIFDSPPIGIAIGYESYTRILEGEFFYANYSVPTSGARNGRVKHVQTTDAVLWENGKRAPEWMTGYHMASSGGPPYFDIASQGAGCYLPQTRFPNESPMCLVVDEFAADGTPGVASIQSITAHGSAGGQASAAFGALELTVWP